MSDSEVLVRGPAIGFAQGITAGRHRLVSDEPSAVGGTDEREIELKGPLSEDQRARLLEIANKCPVHRTLRLEIDIRTRLL